MNKFNPIIQVDDDGLHVPEVREWSIEKYRLVGQYCDIFTAGMKHSWDQLVYIDLFAGAGYAFVKDSNRVVLNAALIAMNIPNTFSKYILCELDLKRYNALKKRVKRDYPHLNVVIYNGDSNDPKIIKCIKNSIPPFKKGNTLLSFCFIDPFSLNLKLSMVRQLANLQMDFLILQALTMDAKRNESIYLNENNTKISEYLGMPNWRDVYDVSPEKQEKNFVLFLANQFQNQMVKMGYIRNRNMHQIKSNVKNLSLYYLAFYSKHKTGERFFKEIQKRANPQTKMDL